MQDYVQYTITGIVKIVALKKILPAHLSVFLHFAYLIGKVYMQTFVLLFEAVYDNNTSCHQTCHMLLSNTEDDAGVMILHF